MTLIDQLTLLKQELDAKDAIFIREHGTEIKEAYEITREGVVSVTLTYVVVICRPYIELDRKRITKVQLEEIKEKLIQRIPTVNDISYGYQRSDSRGAFSLNNAKTRGIYLSKEEADAKFAENQEKQIERAKALEAGGLVCAYCNAVRPVEEMVHVKVYHYHTQRHLDKLRPYCKEKGCSGYHQMSLEG